MLEIFSQTSWCLPLYLLPVRFNECFIALNQHTNSSSFSLLIPLYNSCDFASNESSSLSLLELALKTKTHDIRFLPISVLFSSSYIILKLVFSTKSFRHLVKASRSRGESSKEKFLPAIQTSRRGARIYSGELVKPGELGAGPGDRLVKTEIGKRRSRDLKEHRLDQEA